METRRGTSCPGCGLTLPEIDGPVHRYMRTSPACWAVYGRVLAREYGDAQLLITHRFGVDAYAVQHPGGTDRQSIQSVALHLVRLGLSLDRDLSPDEVNGIAVRLGKVKQGFTWLRPPADRGAVTVADVDAARSTKAHAEAVRRWARSAFDASREHHAQIIAWIEALDRSDSNRSAPTCPSRRTGRNDTRGT